MTGYGLGLALIGGWIVVALAITFAPRAGEITNSNTRPALTSLMVFGGIVLLSRLFFTRFVDDLKGVGVADHYALFGLILGASLPVLSAAILSRTVGMRPAQTLIAIALSGLVLLTAPGLTILLWGAKCALAMMFGLALSCGLVSVFGFGCTDVRSADDPDRTVHYPRLSISSYQPLFALAAALAITQWTHLALPLASLTRMQKVYSVAGVVVALLVIISIADYAGRIARRGAGGVEVEK
jgi:hypothetical protein